MKRLFLASEAKHPDSMKKLEEFVGGFTGKSIAYIPTAANGEEVYGKWKDGTTWNLFNSLDAEIRLVLLEEFKDESPLKIVEKSDIVFLAGGMCGYLLYWLRRFGLEKAIQEIVENGTVLVGSSSGSMICSTSINVADIFIGEEEWGASIFPGLGFVDFEIYPHYEDELYPQINSLWKQKGKGDLYLLKNGEAITVVGDKIEVLGEKRVITN